LSAGALEGFFFVVCFFAAGFFAAGFFAAGFVFFGEAFGEAEARSAGDRLWKGGSVGGMRAWGGGERGE
jgi:hypothetical protein